MTDAFPAGDESAARPEPAWYGPADRALRIVGGVLAVLLAVLTGFLELFLIPVRLGGVPIGLCVLLALVVNYWLPQFTLAATGARWAIILPAGAWVVLMLVAATRRAEGDLLMAGSAMGILTNLAGSLAFGIATYRLILRPVGQ